MTYHHIFKAAKLNPGEQKSQKQINNKIKTKNKKKINL